MLLAEKETGPMMNKLHLSLKAIQQGEYGDRMPKNGRNKAAKTITADDNRVEAKKTFPEKAEAKKDTVALMEERIFQLQRNGNTDEAKRQLVELITSCARKKDFKNAERLRERIYEIDPMALTEILQSGEIIEEEKSGAMDQDLLETWSGLLSVLTQDEFNDLYFTMEKREIKTGEILVSQGTTNDELFFINRGALRISYFQIGTGGDKEIFLENMESGQIAVENFFNATLWTVSLTAVQKTQISILRREDLERLEKKNPGIGSKLHGYSMRSFNIAGLLNRKRLDRRAHERYKVRRKIHLEITGKSGCVHSSFDGSMADISQGGFCFVVKIINKENSRLLLGRDIRATIPLSQGGEQKVDGTVIGLQLRDSINCDFSGHVRFKNVLERQPLKFIIE